MRQRERRREATGARAAVAMLSYTLGGLAALSFAFDVLHGVAHGAAWPYTFTVVFALVPWWIAAGVGVRLGMEPGEFFCRIALFAGFIAPR